MNHKQSYIKWTKIQFWQVFFVSFIILPHYAEKTSSFLLFRPSNKRRKHTHAVSIFSEASSEVTSCLPVMIWEVSPEKTFSFLECEVKPDEELTALDTVAGRSKIQPSSKFLYIYTLIPVQAYKWRRKKLGSSFALIVYIKFFFAIEQEEPKNSSNSL